MENDGNKQQDVTPEVYKCNKCGKIFSYKDFFDRHKRYICPEYTGKTWKCQQCDKNFKTAQQLNNHVLIHSDVRNYKCTECQKSFKQPSALKNHKMIHSGEKPYVCGISGCTKAFRTTGNLQVHVLTHTGEKPHVCEHCSKSFTQSSSLKTHLISHRKEKPYSHKCEVCGKEFVAPGNYKKHLKVHEKKVKIEPILIESDDDSADSEKNLGSNSEKSDKELYFSHLDHAGNYKRMKLGHPDNENKVRTSGDAFEANSEDYSKKLDNKSDFNGLEFSRNYQKQENRYKREHLHGCYGNNSGDHEEILSERKRSEQEPAFDDSELPTFCDISSLFS